MLLIDTGGVSQQGHAGGKGVPPHRWQSYLRASQGSRCRKPDPAWDKA